MMNRDGLVDYLTNQFQKPMDYKEKYIELYNRYHIPEGMSSDALTLRKDLGEYSNYILFCLLSVINPKKLKDYFVDVEIDTFSVTKYEEEGKIELPILIKNMVAVSSDQFIGSVTMQWLMKLGDAQFVNYNAATQRTLKREIKGNAEYYRPYVNRKSVRDIADSMRRGSYIPNVMTFNDLVRCCNINISYFISRCLNALFCRFCIDCCVNVRFFDKHKVYFPVIKIEIQFTSIFSITRHPRDRIEYNSVARMNCIQQTMKDRSINLRPCKFFLKNDGIGEM